MRFSLPLKHWLASSFITDIFIGFKRNIILPDEAQPRLLLLGYYQTFVLISFSFFTKHFAISLPGEFLFILQFWIPPLPLSMSWELLLYFLNTYHLYTFVRWHCSCLCVYNLSWVRLSWGGMGVGVFLFHLWLYLQLLPQWLAYKSHSVFVE